MIIELISWSVVTVLILSIFGYGYYTLNQYYESEDYKQQVLIYDDIEYLIYSSNDCEILQFNKIKIFNNGGNGNYWDFNSRLDSMFDYVTEKMEVLNC